MGADNAKGAARMVANWRAYTASTAEEVYSLILSDRKQLIKSIFQFNSLDKWRSRPEHFEDYRADLCLYLCERYQQEAALLAFYNSDRFRFFLVQYTRNKMMSADGHNRKYGERHALTDDDPTTGEAIHHDEAFELDDEKIRSLRLSDPDVIEWMLGTTHFDAFSQDQKTIYLRWFHATRDEQKRVKIAEIARRLSLSDKVVHKAVSNINRVMRERIKHINNL